LKPLNWSGFFGKPFWAAPENLNAMKEGVGRIRGNRQGWCGQERSDNTALSILIDPGGRQTADVPQRRLAQPNPPGTTKNAKRDYKSGGAQGRRSFDRRPLG